jgi:hypothetical protein
VIDKKWLENQPIWSTITSLSAPFDCAVQWQRITDPSFDYFDRHPNSKMLERWSETDSIMRPGEMSRKMRSGSTRRTKFAWTLQEWWIHNVLLIFLLEDLQRADIPVVPQLTWDWDGWIGIQIQEWHWEILKNSKNCFLIIFDGNQKIQTFSYLDDWNQFKQHPWYQHKLVPPEYNGNQVPWNKRELSFSRNILNECESQS